MQQKEKKEGKKGGEREQEKKLNLICIESIS